jgi:acyl-CoA synthetase (AMP-forming)/AMP-acid ligase II
MYRTGDLGRWLEGGNLEVVGRMDRQLKVRGFRVEPGEIESVLAGHPDIDQVSVVASTRNSGDIRLVAYYTPSAGATAKPGIGTHHPPAATFRSYLLDRLPGCMIPAAFIARHRLSTSPERDQAVPHQSPSDHTAPRHPAPPAGAEAARAADADAGGAGRLVGQAAAPRAHRPR